MIRRSIALGAIFLTSLCVFLIVLMPAAVVVERLPALRPAGAPLVLSDARGRWWQGSVAVRWQQLQGRLNWQLDWHGLTPGVRVDLDAGKLEAHGWLGGSAGNWRLEQWHATVPVPLVARHVPQGNATGLVDVTLMALELDDGVVVDARGLLHYDGGRVTWGRDGAASVPPLEGRLTMKEGGPVLSVTGPRQQELVQVDIRDGRLNVRVHRAWPQLLGVSQGGNPADVVFRMSQPAPFGHPG